MTQKNVTLKILTGVVEYADIMWGDDPRGFTSKEAWMTAVVTDAITAIAEEQFISQRCPIPDQDYLTELLGEDLWHGGDPETDFTPLPLSEEIVGQACVLFDLGHSTEVSVARWIEDLVFEATSFTVNDLVTVDHRLAGL